MERTEDLWTAVSQLLRAQVSDAVWYSTFNDVHSLPSDDTVLRLAVPSGTVRDKITSRYLPLVLDAMTEIGATSTQLEVEVVSNDASSTAVSEPTPQPSPSAHPATPTKSSSNESAAADKAEEMADRIGVINKGRLMIEGTLDELRRRSGEANATLEDLFLELVREDA